MIYYNSKLGYIIGAETTIKGSIMRKIMEPVVTEAPDISEEILGNRIHEGLQKSRNALPVSHEETKNFKFWQVSGIKGFASFSKKFKCIDISDENDLLYVSVLTREADGGYSYPEEDAVMKVSLSVTAKELGEMVAKLFEIQPMPKTEENCSFITLEDTEVIYKRPSDIFVDIGDGNTDAYQIYICEENQKNCIVFSMDSMYFEFKEGEAKRKWEQVYGTLSEFTFYRIYDSILRFKIEGKTEDKHIISYIYQNRNSMLEVVLETDILDTSENLKCQISQEFKNIINSIKVRNIKD